MLRREFMCALAAAPVFLGGAAMAQGSAAQGSPAFDQRTVPELARTLASRPWRAPPKDLPPRLSSISYDAYRAIRYRPQSALWKTEKLPFQAQLFHRGFYFPDRVDLFEVSGGRALPIAYDPTRFTSDLADLSGLRPDLGYAGFRLHSTINRPDYFDEVAVFLGASYFRSLGKGQVYGLSARGLALNTTGPGPEEFPAFRRFWIERPAPGAKAIVLHALLDSPATAGAYRFVITPGERTTFDVETRLFPRKTLTAVGLAPLTSMFLFGPASARRFDDFRGAVHDSDGLQIVNGRGEHLWRPLTNPAALQESAFVDQTPRGFGLIQRNRRLSDYHDLEARYDLRPSLWVEPQGDWGEGAVHLVEIPSAEEIHDNVVAFWRPKAALMPGAEHLFRYRMHWGPPPPSGDLAQVARTRTGAALHEKGVRVFTIEFAKPGGGSNWGGISPRVSSSAGEISEPTLNPNPETGGVRLDFHLKPSAVHVAELRAGLVRGNETASESWMYRWTA